MTRTAAPADSRVRARTEWVEDFLRYASAERRLSPNTVSAYRRDLGQFEAFVCGYEGTIDWGWADVHRVSIRSFMGELELRGLKRASIGRKLAAVRAFFTFLQRTDRVEASPALLLRTPRRERPLPAFLSEDQARALLDSAAETARRDGSVVALRRWALLELLYSCGLRLAEAHGLDVIDVDLHTGQVRALGKGAKERVVPLGRPAAEALGEYFSARPSGEAGAVFPLDPRHPALEAADPAGCRGPARAGRRWRATDDALAPPLVRDPPPRSRRGPRFGQGDAGARQPEYDADLHAHIRRPPQACTLPSPPTRRRMRR